MPKKDQPKWDPGQDYRSGLKAYELAKEFKKQLEPRLPAGLLEGLKEDIDVISSMEGDSKTKVVELKGFTGTQGQHLKRGETWTSAVREALKRGKAPADVCKAAGVGSKFGSGVVAAVAASIATVINAYEKFPEAFRGAGVLPSDIETGKRILVSLNSSDLIQETKKVSNTQATAGRNALRKRVEATVDMIRGMGMLEFQETPAIAARFKALVPPKGKKGGGNAPEPPKA